jgi:integrase
MTARRSRGEGGLHWDESRQRWIVTVTLGFDGRGKRITRKASGRTKTEAKNKLREILRDHEDGLITSSTNYTVGDAVRDWLAFGLAGRAASTAANYRIVAERHVIGPLGARRLRDLTADDVDRWLHAESRKVSTRTLRLSHSLLNRSMRHAMARDKIKRNVVALCDIPTGQRGRPSKSLTFDEAEALLAAAEPSNLHAYIVLSLLTGARTEELRALRWHEVDLTGNSHAEPPIPPSIAVYRSVRVDGDTKTTKSRRRLAMPRRCADALRDHRDSMPAHRTAPAALVFGTANGTQLDAHNVRRSFRKVVAAAELDPTAWTPRELRHSFVSTRSASGVRIEDIARLLGHSGTAVTEKVYRHELQAVLDDGATIMDALFPTADAG